jgi:hypothetical protein
VRPAFLRPTSFGALIAKEDAELARLMQGSRAEEIASPSRLSRFSPISQRHGRHQYADPDSLGKRGKKERQFPPCDRMNENDIGEDDSPLTATIATTTT